MLSKDELRLLESHEITKFPLMSAVRGMLRNCGKCGHRGVNVRSALRLAVTRYRTDPAFVAACRSVLPLPAVIGGVLVQ